MVAPAEQSSQFALGAGCRLGPLAGDLAIVFLGPIASDFIAAMGDSKGLWEHLSQTVLPRYV